VTVAVKPHALDGDGLRGTALPVLTREQLTGARTTLYQLLARSRGLITDYSSVWTDYLCLDRPIGFYCPDLERFRASRGLNVEDYPRLVPGPLLIRPSDLADFLHECLADSDRWRDRRRRTVELLGAEIRTGATERLLDALGL
jgi:CDP-glycerol glycerophosphotransferase